MLKQKKESISNEDSHDMKKYAELLAKSKCNADLYRLVSVAMSSYADGVKNTLRCFNFATANV